MKVVFSSSFRDELRREAARYADISPRLGDDFVSRVETAVRT